MLGVKRNYHLEWGSCSIWTKNKIFYKIKIEYNRIVFDGHDWNEIDWEMC